MATYTPGLKVVTQVRHRVRRVLPIVGEVLVKTGDRVSAEQVVAETFMPGDITPLVGYIRPVDVILAIRKVIVRRDLLAAVRRSGCIPMHIHPSRLLCP